MDTTHEQVNTTHEVSFRVKITSAAAKFRKSKSGVFAAICVALFIGLFSAIEVLNYFKIDPIQEISESRFLIYTLLVILCAAISFVCQMMSDENLLRKKYESEVALREKLEQKLKSFDASDSIVALLRHSTQLGHHKEIVQLGTVLRQSTCLKSNNALKIKIGHFVLESARACEDIHSEATALIEDIGNTQLENNDVDEAIKHISEGIDEMSDKLEKLPDGTNADNELYIIIRGYRNLANCYSFKKDEARASEALKTAYAHSAKLKNEATKLQIFGDLEYAQSKVSRITSNWQEAIKHLNQSLGFYHQFCERFKSDENERKRRESTTKNYRELGDLYFRLHQIKKARNALKKGFEYAKENLDYDNLVRICVLQAKIAKETEPQGEGIFFAMKNADKYIQYVDSPKIHEEYLEMKRSMGAMQ